MSEIIDLINSEMILNSSDLAGFYDQQLPCHAASLVVCGIVYCSTPLFPVGHILWGQDSLNGNLH